MTANLSFNPFVTTNGAGSFNATSSGFISGTALDDPSIRNRLVGGVLASTETLPMWGGIGITELIPGAAGGPLNVLGPTLKRATLLGAAGTAGSLNGFSVFDQAHGMINMPQSPVPQAGTGMTVSYYRLGSGARIALPIDPALVSLDGSIVTSLVSWDYVAQRIVQYEPAYAANTITNAVWANTSGGRTTFTVSSDPTAYATAGASIDVSGVVNTGGTTTSAFNGTWIVVSSTSTTIVVTHAAAASPGTYASGGSVAGGGGALPVRLLDIDVGNSMVPVYDPVTGFVTWNRSGSAAVVLI